MKSYCRSAFCGVAVVTISFALSLGGCGRFQNFTDQEHVQRAKDFLAKGDLRASEIELKNAIGKNPKNAEARWLLGEVYIDTQQGPAAEKEIKRAEELGVGAESLKVSLAHAYLLQGKFKELLDEVSPGPQATARSHAQILKLRGDALLRLRQGREACKTFAEANQKDPEYIEAYRGLALCAAGLEKDPKREKALLAHALELVERAIGKYPRDFDSLALKGVLLQSMDRPGEARRAFDEALKVRPNHTATHLSIASIDIVSGKLDDARIHINTARQAQPQNVQAIYLAALVDHRQGNTAQARDELQQALKLLPGHMPSLSLFGAVSLSLGNYEQAERALSFVLARSPQDTHVRQLLAASLVKQGKAADALETLKPLLREATDVQTLGLAGEIYMALKDPKKAAEFFDQAIQAAPTNVALQTELGVSQLMSGDTSSGIAALEKASLQDPKQTQADSTLILAHIQKREFEKALAAIDTLEKKQPNSPLVQNLRGAVYLSKQEPAKARQHFEQALVLDPTFVPAAKNLAQLDIFDKRPEAARKRFEDILSKDKGNIEAMLALADLASAQRNEADYLKWLDKASNAAPTAVEPQRRLIEHYLENKQAPKALSLVHKLQTQNQDNPLTWELLGRAQLATGEKESALASFTKVTQLEPQSARAHYDLAMGQIATGRTNEARVTLAKALSMDSGHIQSRRALIALDLSQNQFADALRRAEEQTRLQPKSSIGPSMEGDVLIAQKQFSQAAKAYERAFALGKTAQLAITTQQAHLLAGDTKGGDAFLESWIKTNPSDVATRMFLADSLRARKEYQAAAGHYELALQKAVNNVSILNNLALTYGEMKDPRAIRTAEKAYQLAPDHPAVQDTLGWILVAQGQLPRALELLKRASTKAPKAGSIRYHFAVALSRSGKKVEAKKELAAAVASGQNFPELPEAKALLRSL